MKGLGENQTFILNSLRERGCWYPGCGWVWNNYSGTVRLLDSLVKRGLATKETRHGVVKYTPVKHEGGK